MLGATYRRNLELTVFDSSYKNYCLAVLTKPEPYRKEFWDYTLFFKLYFFSSHNIMYGLKNNDTEDV